jgi:aryl-alcohol dehydrogenase-like predicted oxidoreductase
MGTWQTGKSMWVGIDDQQSKKAIQTALDTGITTFDTAESYGNGHSERILGQALKKNRKQAVIATKVFSNHLDYEKVIQACEKSLKNLGTDYIDLYQIHWPPGSFGHKAVPLEVPLRALTDLKAQGKIRAIGVSNFSKSQLEEACRLTRIDSLQPPYSLLWRHLEKETMPYCKEMGITILAYSPMAQGLLTGKFGPQHQFEKGDHRSTHRLFAKEHFARVWLALQVLKPIAEARNITLGQLALAWVISHPATCAIAGARNAQQVVENAQAATIRLSKEELQAMDEISSSVTRHLDDNPVQWTW